MSSRHPVIHRGTSYKLSGRWVKHKTTEAVGWIQFVDKFHDYTEKPADIYVVWPPSPYNKKKAQIKTFSGGVYTVEELEPIKRKRRKTKWN